MVHLLQTKGNQKILKMNQASNASGTTQTTITYLDDNASSIGGGSITSSGLDDEQNSVQSQSVRSSYCSTTEIGSESVNHEIFNYEKQKFVKYTHNKNDTCEDICILICRELNILPTTRTLFGLFIYKSDNKWAVPGQPLQSNERYCFRIRFKVPALDKQLHALDNQAYEYLYWQMRHDMVNEDIAEIRYPFKKDSVTGLAVLDMYIDSLTQKHTVEEIESNYKSYLPRPIIKAHKMFVRRKLLPSFQQFRARNIDLANVKYNYIHQVHNLAPNYLLETFTAVVDSIPGDAAPPTESGARQSNQRIQVLVKLDLHDTPKPGLKISRNLPQDKLEWTLIAELENISALCVNGTTGVSLEITDFPNGYKMQFDSKAVLESFITYVAGYIRLTCKWMLDVCSEYTTPSLQRLRALKCHGPIGGNYSFEIIREQNADCGNYIVRQCEKEYSVYYIDINTKRKGPISDRYCTETFKIRRDESKDKWKLYYNDQLLEFNKLSDLAQHIPTEFQKKFRIPPSEFYKPTQLLICLPKNAQVRKYDVEMSEFELQRARVQIFSPKTDLQLYLGSQRECDNGKMIKMHAEWIQPRSNYKDISVTLKILKYDEDFSDFMKLANFWSKIYSPHFLKLYGITLSTPYSMIMAYSEKGPLDAFLRKMKNIPMRMLLDVIFGLVRGMVYMQENKFVHGYLRCSNIYVTKFDPKANILEAKIADPGLSRTYTNADLPWIPFEHYNDLNSAKFQKTADHWAFATTVWEIFARGMPIKITSKETLQMNYSKYRAILPTPNADCPEVMYGCILDGWSPEPHERFKHTSLFSCLNCAKDMMQPKYESIVDAANTNDETETSNLEEISGTLNGHFEMFNNGLNSAVESNDQEPLMHNHLHNNQTQQNSQAQPNNTQSGKVRSVSTSHGNFIKNTPSVMQTSNGKVICKQVIGEGHYGTVYLGELQYFAPNMKSEKVAIKKIKPLRLQQLTRDFMREIRIMQTLDHPNIVKIKQWIQEPLSIIMEYIEFGSFQVYLSSRKPNLTDEDLLKFAMDIARGMNYLRKMNIIHRDLAARNILVDRDTAKISDFGLAQFANLDGYYFVQSEREIPIKWYSPESIKTGKFSFQSDVWSYGVTLFEMFSMGKEMPQLDPDRELKQDEFLERLEKGDRLRKPESCPDIVYEQLMLPCWDKEPKNRPTFEQIIKNIDMIVEEIEG